MFPGSTSPQQGSPQASAGAAGSMQGSPVPGQQQQAPPSQVFMGPQNQQGWGPQVQTPGHTAAGQAPQSWQQPQGPGQTPLGVSYNQSQPPGAQYQQPQQPQQGQQQGPGGHKIQLDRSMILDGPDLPPELRGRSVDQVMRVYNALSKHYLQSRMQNGQQQGQQPQGQQPGFRPQQPQQQQGQHQQQPGQYQQGYRQNPNVPRGYEDQQDEPNIQDQIRQAVQEAIGPVVQSTQMQSVGQLQQQLPQMIPDFGELQGDILEIMGSATPEMMANPASWELAADIARGRRQRAQRQQGSLGTPPQGGNQFFNQQHQIPQTPAGFPQNFSPSALPAAHGQLPGAGGNGMMTGQNVVQPGQQGFNPTQLQGPGQQHPVQSFFTESPSTPQGFAPVALTPAERVVAQQFGMQPDQYAAWKAQGNVGRRF